MDQMPAPATEFIDGMAPVFSPRANWYGQLAGGAKAGPPTRSTNFPAP
jgi:hypothetical protein